MVLNKSVIIACTAIFTSNAYAWHNEWPKAFKLCNLLGQKVNVKIENASNLKVSVPGSWGDNTVWEFPLEPRACGEINAKTDYDERGPSKFRLAIYPTSGPAEFSVDINNYTTGRYETRSGTDNKLRAWNVTYPASTDSGWNIYAPIEKSTVYERKVDHHCYPVGGGAWECEDREYFPYFQNSGKSIVDLKNWANGAGLALLTAPSDTQELYIVSEKSQTNVPVENILAANVFNNFARVNNEAKKTALRNLNGTLFIDDDINNHPNLKLCAVYAPTYNTIAGATRTKEIHFKPADPEISTTDIITNNYSTPMTFNTTAYRLTNKTVATTWTTTAWKIALGAKVSAKFTVGVTEKTAEGSINYEYSSSDQEVTTREKTEEITLASQQVLVPAGKSISYYARLERSTARGVFNFEYLIDNISMLGKVALDGNCDAAAIVNIDPLVIYSQPEVTLDKGISVDMANKKVVLTGEGNFEGQTGYKTRLVFESTVTIAPGLNSKNLNNPYSPTALKQKVTHYFNSLMNSLR